MLAAFVDVSLPSYIIQVHGTNNNERRDYYVHRAAMDHSRRLRSVYERRLNGEAAELDAPEFDNDNNNDVAHSESDSSDGSDGDSDDPRVAAAVPLKRVRRSGELVQVIDFHMSWVPAYAELTPGEFRVMDWFFKHLAAYEDDQSQFPVTVDNNTAREFMCPVNDAMHSLYRNMYRGDDCTANLEAGLVLSLIVLHRLFKWFQCPRALSSHVIAAIVYNIRHTELAPFYLQYLPASELDTCHQGLVVRLLGVVSSSLLHTIAPDEINQPLLRILKPTRAVHSALQTIGSVHQFEDFHGAEQFDVADFFYNYRCEFFMDDLPLLTYCERVMPTWITCHGSTCICKHITEARLVMCNARRNNNNGSSSVMSAPAIRLRFDFGCIRDLRYIDRVASDYEQVHARTAGESIVIRSTRNTSVDIAWGIFENERFHIVVNYQTSGPMRSQPEITLEIAVLNVMSVETLNFLGVDGGAMTRNWSLPLSDAIRLQNNNHEHYRTNELRLEKRSHTTHNIRHYHYRQEWDFDFSALRGGIGERGWVEYENHFPLHVFNAAAATMPPRMFLLRGSVSFYNR